MTDRSEVSLHEPAQALAVGNLVLGAGRPVVLINIDEAISGRILRLIPQLEADTRLNPVIMVDFSRDQFEIGVARTAQIVGHMAGEIVERLVWILLPNSVNNQNRCLLCLKNGFISHTPTLSLIGPVVFWAPGKTGSCRHQALFLLTLPAEYRVFVC